MEKERNSTQKNTGNRKSRRSNYRSRQNDGKSRAGKPEGSDSYNIGSSATGGNDLSWYSQYPNLVNDSASFPYSWPLGNPIDLDIPAPIDRWASPVSAKMNCKSRGPGIMTLSVTTGPGYSADKNSPANIAARNIYSFVRHANSGHSNYDSQDLMMYLLAMDEIYMWYANICRAYGVLNLFNQQNRYFPKFIVESLGFDYDNLITNMANFRLIINQFQVRFASMAIPKGMSLFDRHMWMYSGIYMDGVSPKAQTYAYVPSCYRVYDETVTTGSQLSSTLLGGTKLTVEAIANVCNSLINPIIGSEDLGIMSGDILKAYGSAGIVTIQQIPENYVVAPVYNEEVLSQFQNATPVGLVRNNNITQDPSINEGIIMYQPAVQTVGHYNNAQYVSMLGNRIITLNLPQVAPGDTMVASRLVVGSNGASFEDSKNILHYYVTECGTEICTYLNIYTLQTTESNDVALSKHQYHENISFAADSFAYESQTEALSIVAGASAFRFHPAIQLGLIGTAKDNVIPVDIFRCQELETYTIVSQEELGNMHLSAVLSEFYIPQVANKY